MKTTLFCKLMERAPQEEGKIWEVTVIKAGLSKNNNLYSKEVLDRACPLFENAPVGIYEFVDTPGRQAQDHAPQWIRNQYPGGVAKNIVGWLRNVHMEGDEMVANLHVTDEWLRTTLVEAWKGGNKELLELSIEARGPSRDESTPEGAIRRVESIDEAIELTVVSKGAAGGRFRRLVASTTPEEQTNRVELVYGGGSYHVVLDNSILASNQDLREAKKVWFEILESAPKAEKEIVMEEELKPQDNSEVIVEEIQESAEEIIEEVTPQVESEFKESSKSRTSMVKALRTLGHSASLDEATTQEVYKLLNAKIAEAAGLKQISESMQNDLMLALQALKTGDSESAILTLENLLVQSGMPEDECEEAVVEGANMKEYKMDIQKQNESQLESETLLADLRAQVAAAKELQESTRALNESLAKSHADSLLESALSKSGLPEVAQNQVRKEFKGKVDMTGLNESIAEKRELLEAAAVNQAPMRSQISMGASSLDHYSAMADVICGFEPAKETSLNESQKDIYRNLPRIASLRKWYAEVMDDQDLTFNKRGRNSVLNEATSASLPELLGDSMYRTLRQRYADQNKSWSQIAEEMPVDTFKVQKQIILGGLGILPTVVESDVLDTYERLGIMADEQITANVETKGGLIVVSRQAIINDDLQGIRRAPQEAAESANHTLNMLVFQAAIGAKGGGAINTDTSYDGTVLFHANHRNIGTAALAYQSFIDSWNRIRNQTRYANVGTITEPIADGVATSATLSSALYEAVKVGDVLRIDAESLYVSAKAGSNVVTVTRGFGGTTGAAHADNARVEQEGTPIEPGVVTCLYPFDLEATAQSLFNSTFVPATANNDTSYINALSRSGKINPLSVNKMYLKQDLTNWYMFSDKPVQVGFLGGRRNPELFLQDNPLVNGVFSGDRLSWKVRHEYCIMSPDHRCIDGNIVA